MGRVQRYAKRKLPIAKFFMKVDWRPANIKHTQYFVNRLEPAAREFQGKILTTIANVSDYQTVMEEYDWKGKETGLIIENGRAKYRFDKAFKADTVKQFFQNFLDNKLEQWVKSEPTPATNDGPVKIVTGKTFNEIVGDPTKDVLIEFYAPWCGHCKQLEPKYKTLGQKFQNVDSVVIAKIDAVANDYPPEYEVSGFPTIFLKPAGKGARPVKFDGTEREVPDFVSFIKKNSKSSWSFKKK